MKRIIYMLSLFNSRIIIYAIRFIVFLVPKYGFYQPIPELKISASKLNNNYTFNRWQKIKSNIPFEKNLSVLDIGCNTGFFCIQLASLGYCVTGLDGSITQYLFLVNVKNVLRLNNLLVGNMFVDPDIIKKLPNYDMVLLLNVFRHWSEAYGKLNALEMLSKIYEKTNKVLFFETPIPKNNYNDLNNKESLEWIQEFFYNKGASRIELLGYHEERFLYAIFK